MQRYEKVSIDILFRPTFFIYIKAKAGEDALFCISITDDFAKFTDSVIFTSFSHEKCVILHANNKLYETTTSIFDGTHAVFQLCSVGRRQVDWQ